MTAQMQLERALREQYELSVHAYARYRRSLRAWQRGDLLLEHLVGLRAAWVEARAAASLAAYWLARDSSAVLLASSTLHVIHLSLAKDDEWPETVAYAEMCRRGLLSQGDDVPF